jgi:hypothetical protein
MKTPDHCNERRIRLASFPEGAVIGRMVTSRSQDESMKTD